MRFDDWLKHFPHCVQRCGFCPVWTKVCFFISDFWWKRLPQNSQAKGRSPVWMSKCVDRVEERLKDLEQCWHMYGLVVECTIMCCFRLTAWVKIFWQIGQVCNVFNLGFGRFFWSFDVFPLDWETRVSFWFPIGLCLANEDSFSCHIGWCIANERSCIIACWACTYSNQGWWVSYDLNRVSGR